MTVAIASETSGKKLAVAGVEQQRLVVSDQKLVERHARWADVWNEGGEPECVRSDLVDVGVHGEPPLWKWKYLEPCTIDDR